jgi:hypothetical protein
MRKSDPVTLGDVQKEQSAGEFVGKMAAEIQGWMDENTRNHACGGKRLIVNAILADGTRMLVEQMSAHGSAVIKLQGEFEDGHTGLLLSHMSSIQFLVSYVPRAKGKEQNREIGFHTGFGKPITIKL